jgi:hypothetical protein
MAGGRDERGPRRRVGALLHRLIAPVARCPLLVACCLLLLLPPRAQLPDPPGCEAARLPAAASALQGQRKPRDGGVPRRRPVWSCLRAARCAADAPPHVTKAASARRAVAWLARTATTVRRRSVVGRPRACRRPASRCGGTADGRHTGPLLHATDRCRARRRPPPPCGVLSRRVSCERLTLGRRPL